jgi:hypothetical protein
MKYLEGVIGPPARNACHEATSVGVKGCASAPRIASPSGANRAASTWNWVLCSTTVVLSGSPFCLTHLPIIHSQNTFVGLGRGQTLPKIHLSLFQNWAFFLSPHISHLTYTHIWIYIRHNHQLCHLAKKEKPSFCQKIRPLCPPHHTNRLGQGDACSLIADFASVLYCMKPRVVGPSVYCLNSIYLPPVSVREIPLQGSLGLGDFRFSNLCCWERCSRSPFVGAPQWGLLSGELQSRIWKGAQGFGGSPVSKVDGSLFNLLNHLEVSLMAGWGPDLKVISSSAGLWNPPLCCRLTRSQGDKDLLLQCWIKGQIQHDLDNFHVAGSLATSNLF